MSGPKPAERNRDWFSWRHQSSEAHMQAQARRQARVAQWEATMERNAQARANRSPQEQIAVLDSRLGKGKGAKRERARLARQIEEAKNPKPKKKKRKQRKVKFTHTKAEEKGVVHLYPR